MAGGSSDSGADMQGGGMQLHDMATGKHQGEACGPNDTCDTGHCVDGYCCDQACEGQCQACDVKSALGTCTTTSDGVPHGSRAACSGSGTCAGACTGASATACTYPPTSTICGAACDGHCDGAGACSSTSGGACPNGFACESGGACGSSCASDGDCQPNFHCAAPSCVRNPESDCLDGKDNNGDGLADCQDPTCTTVQCVDAAPVGDELGVQEPMGSACPTGYGFNETEYQGLIVTGCGNTGCGCSSQITCSLSLGYSSAQNCSPATSLPTITLQVDTKLGVLGTPAQRCQLFGEAPVAGWSIVSETAHAAPTCSSSGATTPLPVQWQTQQTFCGVTKTSATCAASTQTCAPTAPSGQKICTRIPSPDATCPAGYSGMSANWYQGISDGRSCTCDCTPPTSVTCGEVEAYAGDSGCPVNSHASNLSDCFLDPGTCTSPADSNSCDVVAGSTMTSYNQAAVNINGIVTTGTCTTKGDASGTATPAQGSTICCP